jgi:hypothetical protein
MAWRLTINGMTLKMRIEKSFLRKIL